MEYLAYVLQMILISIDELDFTLEQIPVDDIVVSLEQVDIPDSIVQHCLEYHSVEKNSFGIISLHPQKISTTLGHAILVRDPEERSCTDFMTEWKQSCPESIPIHLDFLKVI
jgi:hypothetical protein